jgi:hypothetical protein
MKQEVQMRSLFFSSFLLAGLALAGSAPANAAPVNGLAITGAEQSAPLLLVRNGCGRGRHFSKWRGVCVWNGDRRVYAPRVYGPPVYGPPVYGPPVYYGYGYGYPYRPYGYWRHW